MREPETCYWQLKKHNWSHLILNLSHYLMRSVNYPIISVFKLQRETIIWAD